MANCTDDSPSCQCSADACSSSRSPLRVGCVLLPQKVSLYLTPRMLAAATAAGVELVRVDAAQPLDEQGPFHALLHKLGPNPAWERELQSYLARHPSTVVIDALDGIRQLRSRATMLMPVQGPGIRIVQPHPPAHQPPAVALARAPPQVEVPEGLGALETAAALAAAGLSPPLLCKPLWSDGRKGSHGLAVLHDMAALGPLLQGEVAPELRAPLMVQQFVEHGGVMYKVYVLGALTAVTRRPSLGGTYMCSAKGVQQLPRISSVSMYRKSATGAAGAPGASPRAAAGADAGAAAVADPCVARGAAAAPPASGGVGAAVEDGAASLRGAGDAPGSAPGAPQLQQQQPSPSAQPQPPPTPPHQHHCHRHPLAWAPPDPASSQDPPQWVTSALAQALRRRLGMQLFNFDLIVPQVQPQPGVTTYYVVDINYFPGVNKIPGFEQYFVDFLVAACRGAAEQAAAGSDAVVAAAATHTPASSAVDSRMALPPGLDMGSAAAAPSAAAVAATRPAEPVAMRA